MYYIYMCVVTLYIPKILWVLWLISHILVDALRPGLFELHRWQFPQPRLWNPGPFFRRFSGSRTDTLSEKTRGNPMIIYNKPLGMIYHWVYQIKKKYEWWVIVINADNGMKIDMGLIVTHLDIDWYSHELTWMINKYNMNSREFLRKI